MVRCHVKGCHRSQGKDQNHHFFSEPANLMIRKQWREFCQIEGTRKDVRICSDHFHATCYRKKAPPRPLLLSGAVPTILSKIEHGTHLRHIKTIQQNQDVEYDQATLETSDRKKQTEDSIEFMRPALQHECLRNSKTIIMEIERATENTPATVNIQTNSKIRVVISGRKCNCQKMRNLTRRLNQDPLENLFAIIRQQHGCSTNPSPIQFETGLKQIFITHLSKLSRISNCEVDDNKIFAKLSNIETGSAHLKTQVDYKEFLLNKLSVYSIMGDFESEVKERSETGELTETNAVFYICGYLAKKFLKSHSTCKKCMEYLILPNSTSSFNDYQLFTLMKEHADINKLKYSSQILFESVLKWEKLYQSFIPQICHFKKISEHLNPILREHSPRFQLCTPAATNAFVNTFIRIRCFWEARFRRRAVQEAKKEKKKTR